MNENQAILYMLYHAVTTLTHMCIFLDRPSFHGYSFFKVYLKCSHTYSKRRCFLNRVLCSLSKKSLKMAILKVFHYEFDLGTTCNDKFGSNSFLCTFLYFRNIYFQKNLVSTRNHYLSGICILTVNYFQ